MQPKPPSKLNQRVISPHFSTPSNNASDNFPPGKPRPAPRNPSMPKPRPPPRRTPSPTRPNSGSRDQIYSPPLSSPSNDLPTQKPSPPPPIDQNRPDSASKPPGDYKLILMNLFSEINQLYNMSLKNLLAHLAKGYCHHLASVVVVNNFTKLFSSETT